MRQHAHAAAATLAIAGFRHGGAVVALGDARVKLAQIFRNGSDDFFAFGGGAVKLFLFPRALRLNFFSFRGDSLFDIFQPRLRNFHAAFDFFRGHHHFELAVIGFGHFGLGVGDFMLQRFKGFVGFYRAALIAIFARAVFPLLPVELELLAFRHDLSMGFFRGGDIGAGATKFRFRFADTLGKSFQFRAQDGNLVVNALQLDKVRNRRVHEQTILAQGCSGLCGNRGGG